jgi:hypothetical protein
MTKFYEDSYWHHGNGLLLLQARRLLTLICLMTEEYDELGAAHISFLGDHTTWSERQGFYATWFIDEDHELFISFTSSTKEGDSLIIGASYGEDDERNFTYRLCGSEATRDKANIYYDEHDKAGRYELYSEVTLWRAILAGRAWLGAHLEQLETMEQSFDRLFFGGENPAWLESLNDSFFSNLDSKPQHLFRQLMALAQYTYRAGESIPFLSYAGPSDYKQAFNDAVNFFLETRNGLNIETEDNQLLLYRHSQEADNGEQLNEAIEGYTFWYAFYNEKIPGVKYDDEDQLLTVESLQEALVKIKSLSGEIKPLNSSQIFGEFGLESD